MKIDLTMIKEYIDKNLKDKEFEMEKPFKPLEILRVVKLPSELSKENKWKVYMKGPINTFYEKGVFTIDIYFPNDSPIKKPELRFCNKIYHLNVNPNNGHICVNFMNCWNENTSIKEILVGIYLSFYQSNFNPKSPYSGEMAREYETNRQEFIRKAKEWTLKYASPNESDKGLLKEIEDYKLIEELKKRNNQLMEQIKYLNNRLREIEYQKVLDINKNKDKIIELMEELKNIKSKCPIELLSGEELFSIIFKNIEKNILYSIICKNTDIFVKIESMLYEKYPNLKESENTFTINGVKINKYKNLKENGIQDNSIILFN